MFDIVSEIKNAVLGHNGDNPGLVSDMRDVCTRMESMEKKIDEIYLTGCRFGQTAYSQSAMHNPPHPKDRSEDKVSFKWLSEKLIEVLIAVTPYALIGFILYKIYVH
jgi:hypothetical protein